MFPKWKNSHTAEGFEAVHSNLYLQTQRLVQEGSLSSPVKDKKQANQTKQQKLIRFWDWEEKSCKQLCVTQQSLKV